MLLSLEESCGERRNRDNAVEPLPPFHPVQVLLTQLASLQTLDQTLPSPLAVAVLDAVWRCLVQDRNSLARFLVGQGLDLLLSFLEVCSKAHRQVLSRIPTDAFVPEHPMYEQAGIGGK